MSGDDEAMLDLFRQELATQSEVLSLGLVRLERSAEDVAHVQGMMRAAHSIKGAARIVGLEPAITLAHALEDCFESLSRRGFALTAEGCDRLLGCVDLLARFADVSPARDHALLATLATRIEDEVAAIRALQASSGARALVPPAPEPAAVPAAVSGQATTGSVFHSLAAQPCAALDDIVRRVQGGSATAADLESGLRVSETLVGLARLADLEDAQRMAGAACDALRRLAETGDRDPAAIASLAAAASGLRSRVDVGRGEAPAAHASALATSSAAAPGARPAEDVAPAPAPVVRHDPAREASRFVRITSENLDRLMGLAGESIVQANWLQPFADSLVSLKWSHSSVSNHLERLRELCGEAGDETRAGEVVRQAVKELHEARESMNERLAALEEYARRSVGLSDRLYREVLDSRMRPIADCVRGFPRLVRDVARKLGKSAHLDLVGESTEVDRDILERLEAPLSHLLRNAVDHGIEPPQERMAKGKPAQGRLLLEAGHRAGMLWIRIADDGRGIDVAKIREKVVARGIASADAARVLGQDELLDFLFLPGFTTTDKVTEISGRGVGLDVVRAFVGALGGSVHAMTEPGMGTSFDMELPLTLSVVRSLLVTIAGEPHAVPLTRIEQVLRLQPEETFTVQGRRCCSWNGHVVGLVPASLVLDLEPGPTKDDTIHVLVLRDRNVRYGLCVEGLLGEHDLVVRPITPRLGKIPDVSAAAIMPDGSLVLIIDVDDVMRSIARLKVGGRLTGETRERQALPLLRKRVLVADDSIPVREMEARMLEARGYEVESAVDGEDAWARLSGSHFDLLVTDVDMPNLDGIGLVRRLRGVPAFEGLPVVVISYNEGDAYRQRALEAGADRYVTKSQINTGAWLETVTKLLGAEGAGRRRSLP